MAGQCGQPQFGFVGQLELQQFQLYCSSSMKKVHPRPIKIHKIELSNQSITSLPPSQEKLQCRLCKNEQSEQPPDNILVFPCQCTEPIHLLCLEQESLLPQNKNRTHKSQNKTKHKYRCGKCGKTVNFVSKSKLSCRSWKEVCQFSRQNRCFCLSFVISIVIMLSCLGIAVMMSRLKEKQSNMVLYESMIIGVSILGGLMVILVFYLGVQMCRGEMVSLLGAKGEGMKNEGVLWNDKEEIHRDIIRIEQYT